MNSLRKILWPFSVIYDAITSLRNKLFDWGIWESRSYTIPVISVGNLSVGGTGKSPMIEYLVSFLKEDYQVAILSRGYKRKSSGFLIVETSHLASEVGDEPLQIKKKFPDCTVAVCADRREGIEQLQQKADIILLDDAFQHRKVKPYFSILLTPFDDLYINDFILPAGNLRESRRGAKRADVIMVTKCPEKVAYSKLQEIQYRLKLDAYQSIYFTRISYDSHIHNVSERISVDYLEDKPFTLVTGIAKPDSLVSYLKGKNFTFKHENFPDHHNFTDTEIARLRKEELILTTEKDYVRLQPKLQKFALYYLPIKTVILNDRERSFQNLVIEEIKNFRNSL